MFLIDRIRPGILMQNEIVPLFRPSVVVSLVVGNDRRWPSSVRWTSISVLPAFVVSWCCRRWCVGIFAYAFCVLQLQWSGRSSMLLFVSYFPWLVIAQHPYLVYKVKIVLPFGYSMVKSCESISPHCLCWVIHWLFFDWLGRYMTRRFLPRSSLRSLSVFAKRANFSWLFQFSHVISWFEMVFSQNASRSNFALPLCSYCAT